MDADNSTGYSQVVEDRVAWAVTSTHVYGPHGVISQKNSGGYHYFLWDGHSGVRLLMDGSGVVTDTYDYDAFGNLIGKTGATFNEHMYRGERFDWDLGFQHLRAPREYNPASGRFTTRDSFEGSPDAPASLAAYVFSLDSPVDLSDPSGHDANVSEGDAFNPLKGWRNSLHKVAVWTISSAVSAEIVANFFLGVGPDLMLFGPDSYATEAMRKSQSYQSVLGLYLRRQHAAISNGSPLTGWQQGAPGCIGFTSCMANPLVGVIGTYTVNFVPFKTTGGEVVVVLYNNTSLTSLGHGTFNPPHALPDWDRLRWFPIVPQPTSNVREFFWWIESVR